MAYLYRKLRSPFWYIQYIDADKNKHDKSTGFRADDPNDTIKAKVLRAELEAREYQRVPMVNGAAWDYWVPKFFERHCPTKATLDRYEDAWKWVALWLQNNRIHSPRQLTYRLGIEYLEWRTTFKKRTGKIVGRNTAILELKLLSLVMGEAVRLGHADANPLVSMKIRRDRQPKKPELTDDEILEIQEALRDEPEWMQVSFEIGLHTGCRLRETRIPLSCVDFRECKITFPNPKGGEDRAFSIPMPTVLVPLLEKLKAEKRSYTLEFPFQPSRRWQQFFIKVKKTHLCFHCLRVKIKWFLGIAGRERQYPLHEDTPPAEALVHLNLLDAGQPTHAAVLLFGRQPQRFLLTSEVKCMHFHGTEVAKPIPSYQIYKGTVFELVDQAVDFVMSKISRAVGTRALGPQAPVDYELPHEAVAEAIVNAVAHRDYTSNASVQVMLFADRLEVWNPGELPPPLTPESLRAPHASIPRNPLIADPMFLARYAEKAGSGILDMIARCKQVGLPTPEFRQEGGQFVQRLRRPTPAVAPQVAPQVDSGRNPLKEQSLQELASALGLSVAQVTTQVTTQVEKVLTATAHEARSREELQGATGMIDREHFRKAYIEPLVTAGWLERTIPDKPTSRLQKYRLGAKGGDWLANAAKRRSK